MTKLDKVMLLIYCSFLVDMAFNLVPSSENKYDFFLLFDGTDKWDGRMSWQTYIHKVCLHISVIMKTLAYWIDCQRPQIKVILFIEAADMVDFLLCYSHRWFYFLDYSVEFSDVTFILIAMLIIQTKWKPQRQL